MKPSETVLPKHCFLLNSSFKKKYLDSSIKNNIEAYNYVRGERNQNVKSINVNISNEVNEKVKRAVELSVNKS